MTTGTYLRHYHSSLRPLSFFMLEWMPLTWINGRQHRQGEQQSMHVSVFLQYQSTSHFSQVTLKHSIQEKKRYLKAFLRAILCYFASFKTSIGIFGVIISLILLGRAAFVFPLSILSNFMSGNSEKAPITFKHQVASKPMIIPW